MSLKSNLFASAQRAASRKNRPTDPSVLAIAETLGLQLNEVVQADDDMFSVLLKRLDSAEEIAALRLLTHRV